jgi:DNA repair protein SbcD/Mre11
MNLLFISDVHIRGTNPVSRIDNFQNVQIRTLEFIAEIAKENNTSIVCTGDFFDSAKEENMQEWLNSVYDIFKGVDFYFIAGNHELLYHNIENFNKSNLSLISKFNNFHFLKNLMLEDILIKGFSFNVKIDDFANCHKKLKIMVLHRYCEPESLPIYIENGITAEYLIDNYNADIYVVGDNHKSFMYKKNNKIVFNIGCSTRQNLNEKDYKPSCILFNTETKEYKQIFLPDYQVNVFREELIIKDDRNDRIDSFVKLANTEKNISFDFKKNLETYCNVYCIKEEVREEINIL